VCGFGTARQACDTSSVTVIYGTDIDCVQLPLGSLDLPNKSLVLQGTFLSSSACVPLITWLHTDPAHPSLFLSPSNTFGKQALVPQFLKKISWPESIPTERLPLGGEVSANFFADKMCHVVSVTDPYSRILVFLDRSRYCFFQVALQLYSRGWVDPVLDPLVLRKSGSTGNRTRTSGSEARRTVSWVDLDFSFLTQVQVKLSP
jgi:hypothetical protein